VDACCGVWVISAVFVLEIVRVMGQCGLVLKGFSLEMIWLCGMSVGLWEGIYSIEDCEGEVEGSRIGRVGF
jgi:hypothetical protein